MALTIKGIEAAKPKLDKKSGKLKTVRLSDGNDLYLEVTETSKCWRARYAFEGKEQMLSLGKYPVVGLKEARKKTFCCGSRSPRASIRHLSGRKRRFLSGKPSRRKSASPKVKCIR